MNIFTNTVTKLTFVFIFFSHLAYAANFAIIESQSFHPLQNMDDKWKAVAENLGHSATILSQNTLDDLTNLNGYDILILSNGLIELTNTRQTNIYEFIAQGGNAYIQSEYQVTQPGNEAFEFAINQLGYNFSWEGEKNGNLVPMEVFGEMSEGNSISSVDHFWYGAYGSGDANLTPFLSFEDKHFGFTFCSPHPSYGKIATTSDQDWIRLGYAENLVKNLVNFLSTTNSVNIPSIFVSISNTQPCENEPITYTANIGATNATYTFQWFVNGIAMQGATDADYTSVFQHGDMVNCEIIFTDGCATETVVTPELEVLIIFPLSNAPTITISTSNTSICDNQTITAEANTSDLSTLTNAYLQWTLNGQNISNATNTLITLNNLNEGDVLSCLIFYSNDCNNAAHVISNDLEFTVNTITTPTLSITSDLTNICAGEAVEFTAIATNAGNNPIYQWLVDGNPVGQNSATYISTTLTNTQSISCQITSSDACATTLNTLSNTLSINVSQPLIPTITITADQTTICLGETITFSADGTNLGSNAQFLWLVDGTIATSNSANFITNALTDGQVVTCQVAIFESCVSTNTLTSTPVSISVDSGVTPEVSITSNVNSVCFGGMVTFTASGQNLGIDPQYEWFVDGNATGTNTATFNTNFTDEQTISCSVTATNTCSGTLSASSNDIAITLTDLTLEVIEIEPETCNDANGSIKLFATGGQGPYTFNWDNNNTNTNEHTQLSAGDYSVVATDVNGCSAELEINVPYIAPSAIASIETTNLDCTNTGGSATVSMENSSISYFYAWKNADNETIANMPTIANLQEGLYYVEVTDEFGCLISEEVYIEAHDELLVEINQPTTIQLGDEIKLQVFTNATNVSYSWRADESLSCENCISPIVNPTNTTTYIVTVTNPQGCSANASVTIQVEKPRDVFVPNAFSPNSDGLNDRFTIYGGTDVAQVKNFKIFDRWGAIVFSNENFQPNDETQGWDGKIKNRKNQTGVFVYFAEIEFIDGRVEIYKGDVSATN